MDAVRLVVFPTHLTTARVYYVPRSGKLIQLPTCGEGGLSRLAYSFSMRGKRRKSREKRGLDQLFALSSSALFIFFLIFNKSCSFCIWIFFLVCLSYNFLAIVLETSINFVLNGIHWIALKLCIVFYFSNDWENLLFYDLK